MAKALKEPEGKTNNNNKSPVSSVLMNFPQLCLPAQDQAVEPEPPPLAKRMFFKTEWKREWVFIKGTSLLQWVDRPTQMRIRAAQVGLHGCCLNDMKFEVAGEGMCLGGVMEVKCDRNTYYKILRNKIFSNYFNS